MKVKVRWIADGQGVQERVVEAINVRAAEEQMKSMYGSLPNYACIGLDVITEPRPNQELPTHTTYVEPSQSLDTSGWELVDFAGWVVIMAALVLILFGLFTMPAGIIFIVMAALMIRGAIKMVSGE
jgi:hypothetical protein